MLGRLISEWANVDQRLHPNRTVANAISFCGCLICACAGLMAAQQKPFWQVALVFLVGSSFDAIDGRISRALKETSKFGAYFDALCDKLGEIALYIGLACRSDEAVTIRWLMAASLSGLLCSYIKTLAAENEIRLEWAERKIFGRGLRVAILAGGLVICALITPGSDRGLRPLAQVATVFNVMVCIWREKQIEIACWFERRKATSEPE